MRNGLIVGALAHRKRALARSTHVASARLSLDRSVTGAEQATAAPPPGLRVRWRAWRGRRRPRRRLQFTREGKWFVGLTLAIGFSAINTGNNLLYLILGMLLSMIIVSGILSENALQRLEVTRRLPMRVFAGRPFLVGIALANHKSRLPSFSIEVEDVVGGRPLAKKCYFLKVPARARQHTSYRGEFDRRGRYAFEGFQVSTRFPFAFFRKSRRIWADNELIVLPRIRPVDDLPEDVHAIVGEAPRTRRGLGREFDGLRPYREGEDARDIHWKRSAREGKLVLREYEAEQQHRVEIHLNHWIDLEPTASATDAALDLELEDIVERAASLVAHLNERAYTVTMVAGRTRVVVELGGLGLDRALRALALLAFERGDPAAPRSAPRRTRATPRRILVTHHRGRAFVDAGAFDDVIEVG